MMSLLPFFSRVKKAATDDRDDGYVREKSSCVPSKVDEARHGWPSIRPYIHGSHAQWNHNKNVSFNKW